MEKAKLEEIQPTWNEFQEEKYKLLGLKDVIICKYANFGGHWRYLDMFVQYNESNKAAQE